MTELTAAVDTGDLRQALRVANQQLLRVQKQLHNDPAIQLQQQLIIKSIKVIILLRQGAAVGTCVQPVCRLKSYSHAFMRHELNHCWERICGSTGGSI